MLFLVVVRREELLDAIAPPEFIDDQCTDVGLVAVDDAAARTISHRQESSECGFTR